MYSSTQIKTLKISGVGSDFPTLRLAVSKQLGGGELEPSSMLPSCLLFVRKITDPLPGRLSCHLKKIRLDTAWERAVRNRLNECYQSAVHPENGAIPFNAETVLFQDEAEMLACLARDINLGQQLNHWWWKTVLGNLPSSARDNLAALFCYQAQLFPAMLDYLDVWGKAAAIISSLDNSAVSSIMQLLVQEYKLNELLLPPILSLHEEHHNSRSEAELITTDRNLTETPQQPWDSWLAKEQTQGMSIMQSYLFGVGLGLFRDISTVRSSLFSAKVTAWWAAITSEVQTAETHHINTPRKGKAKDIENYSKVDYQKRADQHVVKGVQLNSGHDKDNKVDNQANRTKSHGSGTLISHQLGEAKTTPPNNPNDYVPFNKSSKSTQPEQAISNTANVPTKEQHAFPSTFENHENFIPKPDDDLLANGIDTKLGGIFYLINLLHYLALPDCFEEQCKLEEQIGRWGLVELLAKALLAEHLDLFLDDPIWSALAQLEGREAREIQAKDFQFSGEYRIPQSWFEMLYSEDELYYWKYDGELLCLWSDAGFVIQQSFCEAVTEKQQGEYSARIFQHYFPFPSSPPDLRLCHNDKLPFVQLTPFFLKTISQPLSIWLALMLPSLQLRLKQALGYKDKTDSRADFFTDLIFCPATLHVTSTHIDLVSQLEHISLPARMAGLDRNPGWVPELGRVISFHFN